MSYTWCYAVLVQLLLSPLWGTSPVLATEVEQEVHSFKFRVTDIGLGCCIPVNLGGKWLIYDAGTVSGYESEFPEIYNYMSDNPSTNILDPNSSPISRSALSPMLANAPFPHQLPKSSFTRKNLAKKVRQYLRDESDSENKEEDKIKIKTIVISHSDADHYNLIMYLIQSGDEVDYIFFGGLPSQYFKEDKKRKEFSKWIKNRISKNTKIYFTAIDTSPIKDFEQILKMEDNKNFAPYLDSTSDKWKEYYSEAFDFGEQFVLTPLCFNVPHIEKDNRIVKQKGIAGNNNYSIVLKITCGLKGASVLLPGDATGIIWDKLLSNKVDLQSTCYIASHHGTDKLGCNSEKIVQAISAKIICVSVGAAHQSKLPTKIAVDNFWVPDSLDTTEPHPIRYYPTEKGSPLDRLTKKRIYETVMWGNIDFILYSDGRYKLLPQFPNIDSKSTTIKEKSKQRNMGVETPSKLKDITKIINNSEKPQDLKILNNYNKKKIDTDPANQPPNKKQNKTLKQSRTHFIHSPDSIKLTNY